MNRVLSVLLLTFFCLAVKGQSALSVKEKDGFMCSNTVVRMKNGIVSSMLLHILNNAL